MPATLPTAPTLSTLARAAGATRPRRRQTEEREPAPTLTPEEEASIFRQIGAKTLGGVATAVVFPTMYMPSMRHENSCPVRPRSF